MMRLNEFLDLFAKVWESHKTNRNATAIKFDLRIHDPVGSVDTEELTIMTSAYEVEANRWVITFKPLVEMKETTRQKKNDYIGKAK